MAYFQEALAVNRELHDPAGLSETLNNLGLAYQSQGRLPGGRTPPIWRPWKMPGSCPRDRFWP